MCIGFVVCYPFFPFVLPSPRLCSKPKSPNNQSVPVNADQVTKDLLLGLASFKDIGAQAQYFLTGSRSL